MEFSFVKEKTLTLLFTNLKYHQFHLKNSTRFGKHTQVIQLYIDKEKDSIEFALAKLCLEHSIPYLGICRGSQVLNVACGGSLYQDLEKEVTNNVTEERRRNHIDYDDYDGYRHEVKIVKNSPLHSWFKDSLDEEKMEILVNSYHHQGVKRLAKRFVPMAFAPDGLIEGFYDPEMYNPEEGKFLMGLQFHPERMRKNGIDEFDYSGCPVAYQEFAKAVVACKKKLNSSLSVLCQCDSEYDFFFFSLLNPIFFFHRRVSYRRCLTQVKPKYFGTEASLQISRPLSLSLSLFLSLLKL